MADKSFFREIDEELRNDRLRRIWKRYGRYIVSGIVLVIVLILGFRFFEYTMDRRASREGDAFLTAITLSDESIEASEQVIESDESIESVRAEIDRKRAEEKSARDTLDRARSSAKSQLSRERSDKAREAQTARDAGDPSLSPFLLVPDPVLAQTEEIFDIAVKDEFEDPNLTKPEEDQLTEAEEARLVAERDEEEKETRSLAELSSIADDSSKIYSTMAQLRRASILAKRGDELGALEVYDDLISRRGIDSNFRLVAQLRSALLLVDLGSLSDVESRTESLMSSDDSPYISLAREALGLANYKSGDLRRSAELFHDIKDDRKAPRGLQRRADKMLELLSSKGILSPQQEELDAEAEAEEAAAAEKAEADDTDTDTDSAEADTGSDSSDN